MKHWIILTLFLVLGAGLSAAPDEKPKPLLAPTLQSTLERHTLQQGGRISSLFPVSITVKGRRLEIESPNGQYLPVFYNGSFYGLFRLGKGITQLNGLPRGTYTINNKRYVLS